MGRSTAKKAADTLEQKILQQYMVYRKTVWILCAFHRYKDQQSSRLIWDGRSFNKNAKNMHAVPAVEFLRLPQLIDSLLQYQFKLRVDAKHYSIHNGIPISSKLSKFFGFSLWIETWDVSGNGHSMFG